MKAKMRPSVLVLCVCDLKKHDYYHDDDYQLI